MMPAKQFAGILFLSGISCLVFRVWYLDALLCVPDIFVCLILTEFLYPVKEICLSEIGTKRIIGCCL